MGFVFTIVYIILTIIGPEQAGPQWASYHVLAYLAGIIVVASVPSMLDHTYLRSSMQTFLFIGLFIVIALSQVANGWLGGVVESWLIFLPSAAVFFFIVANVYTIRRLKVLILAVVMSCLFVVLEALCGYYGGFQGDTFVLTDHIYSNDVAVGQLFRLRGVGFLNDPNDFAQILLIALPLIFIAWRQGRGVANSVIVIVPSALLLWAIYLTHSRGGLLGLAFLALIVSRKRLGTTASTVLAGALILTMLALDFTGGRGISASEGAGRLEAWATGLELFKSAPLFGVGFGNFTDFHDHTAHNSFVLCLAELGLVGSTIWVALLVTVTMSLMRIIGLQERGGTPSGGRKETQHEAAETVNAQGYSGSALADDELFSFEDKTVYSRVCELRTISSTIVTQIEEPASPGDLKCEEKATLSSRVESSFGLLTATATASATAFESKVEPMGQYMVPKQWVVAMLLALISFLTTSWFLSRSYSTTMCLVLGLATATIRLQGADTESRGRSHWVFYTLATEALAIIFIYGIVRLAL
jgi:O-antigen ligase